MGRVRKSFNPQGKSPEEILAYHEDRAQRGQVYKRLVEGGYAERIRTGKMTGAAAMKELGCSQSAISFAMSGYLADLMRQDVEAKVHKRQQGLSDWGLIIPIYDMADGALEAVADYFAEWRAKHFMTPQRTPYVTTPFHRRWVVAILKAIRDGKNLMILSPPRHGKTELLIHFDIFFITRVNPDISIVKVCKSEGLAKKGLASVMDHLENNEPLIEEGLSPGESYSPPRGTGRPWNSTEFTVDTREIVGLKSPTMAAVGAGGTLLSRDGDIWVIDDIQDQQTVYTQDMRDKTRNWFATDLMSRKVSGDGYSNAFIYIGSRQHPDDIAGHLLDNSEWEVIVETAHDEAVCTVDDPDNPANYDQHVDCMLWPEMRPYRWLMGIKNDPERSATYPMIYLNEPTDEGVDIFSREVVDVAKDERRITQTDPHLLKLNVPEPFYDNEGIHHPIRLVAGLDPSGTGYQASFLWAVDLAAFKLYAVDFENRLGGGIHRALDVMQRWLGVYGVRAWIIEENLYHGAFIKDETIQALAQRESMTILPHATGSNKWDQQMGVGVIARMMMHGQVSIPWGNVHTQAKWQQYISQCVNFSRERAQSRGRRSATKSDIVMASWFPLATMQRWRRDWLAEKVEERTDDSYVFDPMANLYTDVFAELTGVR
jgi:hypothetical protein